MTARNGRNGKPHRLNVPPSGRVFAYVRVSTQAQTIAEQQHQLEHWATARGCTITETYIDEAVSALIPFRVRPAGAALWAALRPGDAIVAAWLDRVFRSASDCLAVTEALQQRGVSLFLLDMNNGGTDVLNDTSLRMALYVGATFAQQESERLGRRIQITKQTQKARGQYRGGNLPFGYQRAADGRLRSDPAQQAAIAQMRTLRGQGLSLRAIAAQLQQAGHQLSYIGVRAVLADPDRSS
jgi:putative DNA-invertase from lambdoid prophage Rac